MSRANKRLTLLENNKFAYSCFKVLKHLPLWKICEKNDPLNNIDIFVQIVCDEQEFKCHMFVLAARSPVFQVTFFIY